MTSKRVYFLLIGSLVGCSLLMIAGTYLATQQFQKESRRLQSLKLQNEVLIQEQNGLAKAKRDGTKYTPLKEIAKAIVPQDKDQAQAVREIIKIASASGVNPTSITFPSSTLGAKTGTTSITPSGGSVVPKAAPKITQVTPVADIPGVFNLQITIQQDQSNPVTYTKFIDFLRRLEQNRRTAQVTSISLQPNPKDRTQLAFTITVDEFIKP